LSSRYVFWPVLLKDNIVTSAEDETYSKFYETYSWYPDLYIYLSKSPEKCFEHIHTRSQAGDSEVSLEYLQKLDIEYKKLLRNVPCKVIVVHAERPVEEIHKEIYKHITENELFFDYSDGKKMFEKSRPGRKMQCSYFTDMCRLS